MPSDDMPVLEQVVPLLPDDVQRRLAAAAPAGWEIGIHGGELRVSPPSGDAERPRTFCVLELLPEPTGTRVRVLRAGTTASARRGQAVVAGVLVLFFVVFGALNWRDGSLGLTLAVAGILLFLAIIWAAVSATVDAHANQAVRRFVETTLAAG